MAVAICFLRGINVGGRNMIRMEALRAVCTGLGASDARTLLQSGNVVCRVPARLLPRLAERVEGAIEEAHGFRPRVIVRTPEELRAVVKANPFAGRNDVHPSRLLVMFLAAAPGAEARRKIREIKADPEEIRFMEREAYIHFPNGVGKSKLPIATVEKSLGIAWTGRNWNTVQKALAMAEGMEGEG